MLTIPYKNIIQKRVTNHKHQSHIHFLHSSFSFKGVAPAMKNSHIECSKQNLHVSKQNHHAMPPTNILMSSNKFFIAPTKIFMCLNETPTKIYMSPTTTLLHT